MLPAVHLYVAGILLRLLLDLEIRVILILPLTPVTAEKGLEVGKILADILRVESCHTITPYA